MTHFLDTLPFDSSQPAARELRSFLADAYFREQPIMQFAADVGVKMATVNWEPADVPGMARTARKIP